MWVTMRTMLSKRIAARRSPSVFEYPEVPVPVKARYRGFHRFDLTTCIGCDKCADACPVDCIYIDKEKSPVGKGFHVTGFTIDYTKCMFCALCVEPCPVDCIFMGSTHDLSCYSRDGCIVDFAKLPLEVAWGQATLNPTAVAESKVLYEPVWVKGEPSPFEFAAVTTNNCDSAARVRSYALVRRSDSSVHMNRGAIWRAKEYFTAAAANQALPLVRAIVQDIVELHRDVADAEQRLNDSREADAGTGSPPRRRPLRRRSRADASGTSSRIRERLEGYVHELEKLGVEFKDPVNGLVDFPTVIDGKDAFSAGGWVNRKSSSGTARWRDSSRPAVAAPMAA